MKPKRGHAMWNGNKLQKLRTQFGETQLEFAERLGVAIGTLRDWEQERTPLPLPIQKLLDYVAQELSIPA